MENKEVVLLTIVAAKNQGLSPLQLQKSLFLIGQSKLPGLPTNFYEFVAYNYGPFNSNIYLDADVLVAKGFVDYAFVSGQSWAKYVITPRGLSHARKIKNKINEKINKHIKDVVNWILPLTFSELLRAIYAEYPEFRSNSVFQS